MDEDLDKSIRELSEIYDPDSIDSYVSLYLNKDTKDKFIDRRERACKSVLKKEELKNFENTMANIRDAIKKKNWNNIAVFASHKHEFLRIIPLSVKVENLLIVDSSPYLRPLARIQDEWESFTLLLISSNYAKIFSVSLGIVEHEKKLSADIMNKHKKGGMSQMRFNRLRRGAIHTFFFEIVEALQKVADVFAERLFGIPLTQAHSEMICIDCRKYIGPKEFKDELSRKEYEISGLCPKCQDSLFKKFD